MIDDEAGLRNTYVSRRFDGLSLSSFPSPTCLVLRTNPHASSSLLIWRNYVTYIDSLNILKQVCIYFYVYWNVLPLHEGKSFVELR